MPRCSSVRSRIHLRSVTVCARSSKSMTSASSRVDQVGSVRRRAAQPKARPDRVPVWRAGARPVPQTPGEPGFAPRVRTGLRGHGRGLEEGRWLLYTQRNLDRCGQTTATPCPQVPPLSRPVCPPRPVCRVACGPRARAGTPSDGERDAARRHSESIAIYALRVDAKDDDAKRFHEACGFSSLPSAPLRLFLPLARMRRGH